MARYRINDMVNSDDPSENFTAYNGLTCELVDGTPGRYNRAGYDVVVRLDATREELVARQAANRWTPAEVDEWLGEGWDHLGVGPGYFIDMDSRHLVELE